MGTTSTTALLKALRAQLLTGADAEGRTAGDALGPVATARLWIGVAPDDAAFPYGVMRLQGQRFGLGGVRLDAELELLLFGRPRSEQASTEGLADLCVGALLQFADASDGLLTAQALQRDTMDPVEEPGDSDIVQIRCLFRVIAYPTQLSQYVTP
jgi:hypothetical protein